MRLGCEAGDLLRTGSWTGAWNRSCCGAEVLGSPGGLVLLWGTNGSPSSAWTRPGGGSKTGAGPRLRGPSPGSGPVPGPRWWGDPPSEPAFISFSPTLCLLGPGSLEPTVLPDPGRTSRELLDILGGLVRDLVLDWTGSGPGQVWIWSQVLYGSGFNLDQFWRPGVSPEV